MGNEILAIFLLVLAAILYIFFIYILATSMKRKFVNLISSVVALVLGALYILYLFTNIDGIVAGEWAQIFLLLGLVAVTGMYALSTSRQADASVKMAEEMKGQRISTSRPIVIVKAVPEKEIWEGSTKDYFAHFEISTVGNNPAIEVEISLTDKEEKDRTHSVRQTYLSVKDSPIKFRPFNIVNLDEDTTYHIVCEYQDAFSGYPKKAFCKTSLPFEVVKASQEDKIYIKPGELEFCEVPEEARVDAFYSGSKPK